MIGSLSTIRAVRNTVWVVVCGLQLVPAALTAQDTARVTGVRLEWKMPSMPGMKLMMLPGMEGYRPPMTPYLPGLDTDPLSLPAAMPRKVVKLADGDTLMLEATLVRRTIRGKDFVMYGFNRQYPGPLITVDQNTTVTVMFTNNIDLPTTIHWHGVRIDNRYDGVPGVTQDAVEPGETFTYRIHFPDAGIYWYHPHQREDIQQELGLYGNMLVNSPDSSYFSLVNRAEILILDDLLMEGDRIAPFGLEASNNVLMGRFGNLFLVNGEPDYHLTLKRGDVVRFFLTNVANTRLFNVSFGNAELKVVGGDIGKLEQEEWVPSVPVAPAERWVVEARFSKAGKYAVTNRVQALNHVLGEFYSKVDTIGMIDVADEPAEPDYAAAFGHLRANPEVTADVNRYRSYFDRAPDEELLLTIKVGNVPQGLIQFMTIDTTYFTPLEWNDAMPMMNWVTNTANLKWVLRDPATGRENMDIGWVFDRGDVVKIRIHNDENSFHPMSHPIHLHGQRFLVLERDGVRNSNFVWKDTALIPVGSTVDLLVDVSNPGSWMLHCHIAEHLEAGMHTVFTVRDQTGN